MDGAWYNAVVPAIAFGVLGPLDVRIDGRTVVLRGHKQRLLLALLLLRAGEVMSTDRLLVDIWGEQPPKAALSSLQNRVSQLRKALGRHLRKLLEDDDRPLVDDAVRAVVDRLTSPVE